MSERHIDTASRRPSNYQIIIRALEMLKFGILSSDLPDRLIDEFGLIPDCARELAGEAIELHKKSSRQGSMATKSFNKPGF